MFNGSSDGGQQGSCKATAAKMAVDSGGGGWGWQAVAFDSGNGRWQWWKQLAMNIVLDNGGAWCAFAVAAARQNCLMAVAFMTAKQQ